MRFLADENFPAAGIAALRSAGSDVVWIRTSAPGCSDPEVLAWAAREERILLTFDKDFGELAKASALPAGCGVILFRIVMPRPDEVGRYLADLIMSRSDCSSHFSVVEPSRIRMRRLRT